MPNIFVCAANGNIKGLEECFDEMKDPEAIKMELKKINVKGKSPLYIATENGHLRTVELLISKGANVDMGFEGHPAKGETSITPLHVAAEKNHIQMIKLLVQAGANINAVTKAGIHLNSGGKSPLHFAVIADSYQAVEELLKIQNIVLNKVDNENRTVMHYAAMPNTRSIAYSFLSVRKHTIERRKKLIDLLICYGAQDCLNVKDKMGKIPSDIAKALCADEIVKHLADIESKITSNQKNMTLHLSA